jgi:hypothetical protein
MENVQYNTRYDHPMPSMASLTKKPQLGTDNKLPAIDDLIEGFDIRIKQLKDCTRQIVDAVTRLTGEPYGNPPLDPEKPACDGKLQQLRKRVIDLREINDVLEFAVRSLNNIA